MSALLKALSVIAAIYLAVAAAVTLFQRSLQYFPDATAMDPARAGFPEAERIGIRTADGETLVAWWRAPKGETDPVYLYLHGNGGNLMLRGERLAFLAGDGAGVLALSWRGYGGSTGQPTEAGLRADADAAFAWLTARVPVRRIVLFGESLGTAMAVRLAAREEVGALVLDSPCSSALDIARSQYFWLPVRLLMFDQFRSAGDAPAVRAPVLAVHCRRDPVIPLAYAEALVRAFGRPVDFFIVEQSCHVPTLAVWRTLPGAFARKALAR